MRHLFWRIVAGVAVHAAISLLPPTASAQTGTKPAPPPAPVTPQSPPSEEPASTPTAQEDPKPTAELPEPRMLFEQARSAYGDAAKIADLASISIKATLPLATGENVLDVESMRSGAFRFVQRGQEGLAVAVYFDGSIGWIAHSDGRYELIDDFTLERGRHQFNAMFPCWLMLFPEERFKSFETVEKSTFNDRDCYKVRLHDDVKNIQRFAHFDVEEKLMRGMTVTQDSPTGAISVQFKFNDWKEIEGVRMFTRVNIDQPNQPMVLTYTLIEFNTVSVETFDQPEQVNQMVRDREKQAAPSTADAGDPAPPADDQTPQEPLDDDGDVDFKDQGAPGAPSA